MRIEQAIDDVDDVDHWGFLRWVHIIIFSHSIVSLFSPLAHIPPSLAIFLPFNGRQKTPCPSCLRLWTLITRKLIVYRNGGRAGEAGLALLIRFRSGYLVPVFVTRIASALHHGTRMV